MYEKQNAKQQNGLMYGFKLRYIGAIQGLLGRRYGSDNIEVFTPEEQATIEGICDNAKLRAKKTFEEVKFRLADTEASSRPEAEHRQYNGK